MALSTAGIARGCARHPWRVIAIWLLLVAGSIALQPLLQDALTDEARFTSEPDSVTGDRLLEDRLRGPRPVSETVVITSDTLTADDPAFQAVVDATVADLRGLEGLVSEVTSYYEARAAGAETAEQLVSADRRSLVMPVTLGNDLDAAVERGEEYLATIEGNATSDVRVLTVGAVSASEIYGKTAEEDLTQAELIGIPVALLILVAVFGALVAAGVPLIVALLSIAVALGLSAVIGTMFDLSTLVVNVITMIGLAVGIDYTLFIVERYREERRHGMPRLAAIEHTGATATKAVVFSGTTVIIALAGIFMLPISIFRSLGLGAILVVFASVLAALTLVPAVLRLLGDWIDWPRRRDYDDPANIARQDRWDHETIHAGFWGRITRVVMARPWVSMILAAGLLATLALPYFDMRTGQVGVETYPPSIVKDAYLILDRDFYAGVIAPVEIVIDGDVSDPAVAAGIDALVAELGAEPLFGPATVTTNEEGDLTLVSAPLSVEGTSAEGEGEITRLRDVLIPQAFDTTDASVYVSGDVAFNYDFNAILDQYTPIVFAFVLGLSFLLLTLAFRSIVVPFKAIVMNLLSVGAAYGLLVLVFQRGYGNELFGYSQTPVVSSWIPIFLFCILFGLSMDYHVFLLSRIREHYDATHDNRESVAVGLQATAKIITGAALIMVAVFGAFSMGRLVELQQMGFGLAIAVLLDATIVRSILVPSAMALLGDWNWYLPRWLHWLPDLRVEGSDGSRPQALTPEPLGDD